MKRKLSPTRTVRMAALTALCAVMTACEGVFDYHPYDVRFSGDDDINRRQMERIEAGCADKDTLRVAFVSDTHGWYSETKTMVNDLNRRTEIDFVVHLGDLTDCATTREFVWTRDILAGIRVPYVALLGNHDCLGTGEDTYKAMYGESNFSFIAGRVKFICLNTNATEYDYVAPIPNLDYIEEEARKDTALFDRTIVCMHARPYSDQFNNNVARVFGFYISQLRGILFAINGHDHSVQADELFDDGIVYYGVNSASHRSYHLFTITPDGYDYEIIDF